MDNLFSHNILNKAKYNPDEQLLEDFSFKHKKVLSEIFQSYWKMNNE